MNPNFQIGYYPYPAAPSHGSMPVHLHQPGIMPMSSNLANGQYWPSQPVTPYRSDAPTAYYGPGGTVLYGPGGFYGPSSSAGSPIQVGAHHDQGQYYYTGPGSAYYQPMAPQTGPTPVTPLRSGPLAPCHSSVLPINAVCQADVPIEGFEDLLEDRPIIQQTDFLGAHLKCPTSSIQSTIQKDVIRRRRGPHKAYTALFPVYTSFMFRSNCQFYVDREGAEGKTFMTAIRYANSVWTRWARDIVSPNGQNSEESPLAKLMMHVAFNRLTDKDNAMAFVRNHLYLFENRHDALLFNPFGQM